MKTAALVQQAQALKSSHSQDNGVVFALFQLLDACINVAPQWLESQIRPLSLQLNLPANAAGSYKSALRQVSQRLASLTENQAITNIFSLTNRTERTALS